MQNRPSVQKFTVTGIMLATALSGSIAPLALAQTPAADSGTGEAVIITGSNIKRTDYEGPQSVVVYDNARIQRLGVTTVNDLIRRLPQTAAGFSEAVNTGSSFSPGAAAGSLRGLGESATLVLINGRRIAPFALPQEGTTSFYDLNSIPIDAVDRVEILREGASAVYGSDAIAGVINVILKSNYSGFQTFTQYGNTTEKDAGEFQQSFLSGFSNEKFHLQISGSYLHRNSIASSDRGFSKNADHREFGGDDFRSSGSNPGTIFTATDILAVPKGSNGRLQTGDFLPGFTPDGNLRNRFNFQKYIELLPEIDRRGFFTTFGYNLNSKLELFGEVFYQAVKTTEQIAPSRIDLTVPTRNPFNPFGEPVGFAFRSLETGPRRTITDLDNYRYLAGFKVKDLPNNWTAEGAFLYSESNVVSYENGGFLGTANVLRALDQTDPRKAFNVFGDGLGINNPSVLKGLGIKQRTDGLAYIFNYDVKATGELFQLPAGPLSVAVGGEYREESLTQTRLQPPGAVVGEGGSGSSGDRDVRSLFYEFSIPVTSAKWNIPGVRALEFTIAQRYDDYSDFGDVAKPKFGFKWKPIEGLLFRGAYSEGFRAPSLPQLFVGQVQAFQTVLNPRTGLFGDVPITTGGNPALKPETSYSYFLGAIIDPPFVPGLSIGLDLFRIEQRGLIDQLDPARIITDFPGQVTFDGQNNITNIDATFQNLGRVVTDGFDIDLSYTLKTRIGEFSLETNATFVNSYEQIGVPGDANEEDADTYQLPDFKLTGSLFYRNAGFELGLTVNYIGSYDDIVYDDTAPVRKVGSNTTLDLQASYEFDFSAPATEGYAKDGKKAIVPAARSVSGWRKLLDKTKITVGVLNVGDVEPPFSNIEEGYDSATADARGRFIYASVRKTFW